MTPEDVPDVVITAETLFPWLAAIAPAREPERPTPASRQRLRRARRRRRLARRLPARGTAGILILPSGARTASTAPPASASG